MATTMDVETDRRGLGSEELGKEEQKLRSVELRAKGHSYAQIARCQGTRGTQFPPRLTLLDRYGYMNIYPCITCLGYGW